MLNVKNPKVYQNLTEFVEQVANYSQETGLQGPEATVRYAEQSISNLRGMMRS